LNRQGSSLCEEKNYDLTDDAKIPVVAFENSVDGICLNVLILMRQEITLPSEHL